MTPAARCAATIVAVLTLASCSLIAPYPTAPSPAKTTDTGPRVAMCYNPAHTSAAQAREGAQTECPAGTVAEPADTDWYLQNCAMFLPAHTTFICTKK